MLHSVKTIQPSRVVDGGVEAERARYRSRNSPETKKLFFTATELVYVWLFPLDSAAGFGFHIYLSCFTAYLLQDIE